MRIPRPSAPGALLLPLLFAACVPRATLPPPEPLDPVATPRRPAAEPARGRSWEFAYAAGTARYSVTTEAEVEAAQEPGSRQRTGSVLHVTYEFPGGAQPVIVLVDSFEVRAGGASASPLSYPLRFVLPVDGAERADPWGQTVEPADCERPDATVRAIARSALPATPPSLAPGTTWRDSVAVASCRGGIPISVVTLSEYRVEQPGSDGSLLPVHRTSTIAITGAGTAAGATSGSSWVTGSGSADGRLFFDLASGRLENGLVQSRITITLDAPGQYRTFRQQAVQEIRRLP